MFGDSISLVVGGETRSLKKINQDNYASVYQYRNEVFQLRLQIRHVTTSGRGGAPKHDRHNVELVQTVFAVGDEPEETSKAYFVMESLPSNMSNALMLSLASWASATSGANLDKVLNWES